MLAIPGNNSLKAGELNAMLCKTLVKERKLAIPAPLKVKTSPEKNLDIKPSQRNDETKWLLEMTSHFGFSPETYTLSVVLLDQFLNVVKARPKYMRCIAISCFFLAAKMKEEDEDVPATQDLVRWSKCGCSVAEVLRMERVILDKLKWDINHVTGLDFLQIFQAMLLSQRPWLLDDLPYMTPSRHLALLTSQLCKILTDHKLSGFRGSTIAASLLSLDLEVLTKDWLAVTIVMQQLIGIDSQQLIRCRELIASTLYGQRYHPLESSKMSSPKCKAHETPVSKVLAKSAKRKIDMEMEDDIYDSIKRLYNEDNYGETTPRKIMPPSLMSCRTENKTLEESLPACNPFASLRVS
ncbi:putative cyclin-I [Apostichopus japonicus]|uniref:Putative cyclin-I n=1 Tax=Stichopus japonicus TaxID=307972 RepID=A0A2G8KI14_STIJA|nr:putative cyclin-I [Apostichopus japonicus]